MRKIQRLSAVGALAALTFSIAACSNSEEASTTATTTTAAAGSSSSAASSSSSGSSSAATSSSAGNGVTQISDIFGPGCSAVPTEGKGSAAGMVSDPVGTAASNNPLLTTLTSAVTAAGLVETLNDTSAAYTVFAPDNDAFAAIPADTLNTLLADPSGQLTTILTYHVIPQRYDAAGLVAAKQVASVQGGEVTIAGSATAPTINGNPVVCGNIPTANATVFVLGSVLMPPA